jgi:hypothetical protein
VIERDEASAAAPPGQLPTAGAQGEGMERNEGPQSEKRLVVARVAVSESDPSGSPPAVIHTKGVLVPQAHGGAIKRGGNGRKPTKAERARVEAGNDLLLCERLLRVALREEERKVVDGGDGHPPRLREGEKLDVTELSAIATALVRIAGDRPKAPRAARTHFGVLRQGEGEARKVVGE